MHELIVFPKGKDDDQVDSTAQFLDWFSTQMPSWGIFEYYRREAEKLQYPERFHLRLWLPPGNRFSHVGTMSEKTLIAAAETACRARHYSRAAVQ